MYSTVYKIFLTHKFQQLTTHITAIYVSHITASLDV